MPTGERVGLRTQARLAELPVETAQTTGSVSDIIEPLGSESPCLQTELIINRFLTKRIQVNVLPLG